MKRSRRGIALLIVLWVLTILMVTGFSFSVLTRAETFGILAFREQTEQKFLAEAGIERGVMEIIYRAVNQNQTVVLEGREVWKLDGTAQTVDMGTGSCSVLVIDESGKIPLNGLTDASGIVLKNLLLQQGVSPEQTDTIVDAILDWKDADDLHRLHGAENDYYLSLAKPYKARNADFEALEELIFVRGITPEILYGEGEKKGIIRFLTLYSPTRRINVNTAPKEVLAALPGMEPQLLPKLMEMRSAAEIRSGNTVMDILGAGYPLMAPYIDFNAAAVAKVFTIEATGYKSSREKGYSISGTVSFDQPTQYRYLSYRNPAGNL
jgi:general secretion pathway protein K